ncbi:hypothetical protein B7P43_G05392 [Cryptotermes secundus]|uniref:Protein regulator of cytokinesis 1 n=1 Tax=Cryptotermes secundus TaxID=105785 RepID=A0A2J7Q7H9_9NEOP|nr:hypothetical protein B7P43_G05392 [Cryptotermes secundus]
MILQAMEYTFIILILMLQLFWEEKIREGKLHLLKYKIKNLRDEIQIWWEKCFLSEDEKQEFDDYKSTDYTNQLYVSHVEELGRLKRKFYRNESLYLLIEKQQDTWKRVVNMDKQLYNPERLFQNRGAQLLQEERERRAAQKDLPQLEELIKKETELYEREHGRPFLLYGQSFSDMILYQKEQHKENQKSLKITKKKCENSAAPSTAPKTITSVSKLKRKLVSNIQSPASAQDKQARVASCEKHASHPVEASRPKRGLKVRQKLIERTVSVPAAQP